MNRKAVNNSLTNRINGKGINLIAELTPENEIENAFLHDAAFVKGLLWGKPRYGHPEGQVFRHIKEVMDNIDTLQLSDTQRFELRLAAFVHDTFKYLEDKSSPRDWSKHHGVYARKFLERYYPEKTLLNLVELHDEAYYIWRLRTLYGKPTESERRLERLLDIMGNDLQLYYFFFKCDTMTGDKTLAPLSWFESHFSHLKPAPLSRLVK